LLVRGSSNLLLCFLKNPLGLENYRPVDHLAVVRDGGAAGGCGNFQDPLSPGDLLGGRAETLVDIGNLLGVDAEFAAEAKTAGALRGGAQLFRIVSGRCFFRFGSSHQTAFPQSSAVNHYALPCN
jgi:hypothetical protein